MWQHLKKNTGKEKVKRRKKWGEENKKIVQTANGELRKMT